MSLLIGKHIYSALKASAALKTATGSRIYPVVAPTDKNVQFPYITFASDGFSEEGTKDGTDQDIVNVEIMVVAKSYSQLGQVAQMVREAMKDADEATYDEFSVVEQTLQAGSEDKDIVEDAYYVPLHYSIVTEPTIIEVED